MEKKKTNTSRVKHYLYSKRNSQVSTVSNNFQSTYCYFIFSLLHLPISKTYHLFLKVLVVKWFVRQRDRGDFQSASSLPKCLPQVWSRLWWSRSPELKPGLPHGWQEPKLLNCQLLPHPGCVLAGNWAGSKLKPGTPIADVGLPVASKPPGYALDA